MSDFPIFMIWNFFVKKIVLPGFLWFGNNDQPLVYQIWNALHLGYVIYRLLNAKQE